MIFGSADNPGIKNVYLKGYRVASSNLMKGQYAGAKCREASHTLKFEFQQKLIKSLEFPSDFSYFSQTCSIVY